MSQLLSSAQDNSGHADSASAPKLSTASGGAPESVAVPSTDRLLATGTNYARASLTETIRALGLKAADVTKRADADASGRTARPLPWSASDLQRLGDRAALAACLAAVTSAHNRGPIVVDFVDYASFEGSPAVVISFVDQGGERWAWVAGPACGQPQSGADTRYRARVG